MARKYEIVRRVVVYELYFTLINKETHEMSERSELCYETLNNMTQAEDFIKRTLYYDEVLLTIDRIVEITGHYGVSRKDYLKVAHPVSDPICKEIKSLNNTIKEKE